MNMTKNINKDDSRHPEMTYNLIILGVALGYKIWIANNDKSKSYNGKKFSEIDGVLNIFPHLSIKEAGRKIVERIDVLWIEDEEIIAAWEIENTTGVFTALDRFNDLLCRNRNYNFYINILYPDDRRNIVMEQIRRPGYKGRFNKDYLCILSYSEFDKIMKSDIKILKSLETYKFMEINLEKPLLQSVAGQKEELKSPQDFVVTSLESTKTFLSELQSKYILEKCNSYNIQNTDIIVGTRISSRMNDAIKNLLLWFNIPTNSFEFIFDNPDTLPVGFIYKNKKYIGKEEYKGYRNGFKRLCDILTLENKNFDSIVLQKGKLFTTEGTYFEGCFFRIDKKTGLLLRN